MVLSEPTICHACALSQPIANPLSSASPSLSSQPLAAQTSRELSQTQSLEQAADRLGGSKHDVLRGTADNDLLRGRDGNDRLLGRVGADWLYGDRGNDTLRGGNGNDWLTGGSGKNLLWGEGGNDVFTLSRKFGSKTIAQTSLINDFTNGQDTLKLTGIQFADLRIRQGKGQQAGDVLIQNKATGEYLVMLKGIKSSQIDATDFGTIAPTDPTIPGGSTPLNTIPAIASLNSNIAKFSPSDSEAAIAATGAARIKLGTQTIYIGTQQVTSLNQNPIAVSFDSSNPSHRWTQTGYEITGTDGRGYGLFWSGSSLYGVFSVDGTQGTPDQDFRRVSSGATQSWLRSYGSGGGAKAAVLAKINPATGDMTEAVYLSSILSSGKTNSLAIDTLTVNAAGNLVVKAQSYYAPRRPDGQAMTQVTTDGSPFDYTLEITPDLKTVVSTAAVGWQ
ncbi:MAG TPA: hypothetical protein V6C84_23680 [Coleofasciculaceae cyanobacterium]|jgi:hypothetical protein